MRSIHTIVNMSLIAATVISTVVGAIVSPGLEADDLAAPRTIRVLQRLVDLDGQPVAGAKAWAWFVPDGPPDPPMRISNDEGFVIINDVPARGAWLFVEADGFRFSGTYVHEALAEGPLMLIRTTERPPEPFLHTLEALQPSDDVRRRGQEALRQFARELRRVGDAPALRRLERILARHDPDFALALREDSQSRDWHDDGVRIFAARSFLPANPARAEEIISTIADPHSKAWELASAASEIAPHRRDQAIDWLQQAKSHVDEFVDSSWRAEILRSIGQAWRDVGDDAMALAVLREGVVEARKPSENERIDFARASVAWTLAPLDLQAALDLMPIPLDADLPDETTIAELRRKMATVSGKERALLRKQASLRFDHGRYYGNVAHNIAEVNPAEAERLLMALEPSSRNSYVMRVCYRMASVDFERAKRIALSVDDPLIRAFSLGVMADAIAESDNEQARQLILDAYTFLIATPKAKSGSGMPTSQSVALGLLPSVERVDPSLLRELIWRTIALGGMVTDPQQRKSPPGPSPFGLVHTAEIAAAMVARYDRELARHLSLAFGKNARSLEHLEIPTFTLGAMAAIDPDTALEALIGMPHDTVDRRNIKVEAWEQVLSILDRSPTERWNWIVDEQLHQWYIDQFDL